MTHQNDAVRPAGYTVDEHVARLTSDRVLKKIIERTGRDEVRIRTTLNIYAAEFRYGFQLIADQLPAHGRILEVGAGLGMLSSYLHMLGYDITALEPCGISFDFFADMQTVVLEEAGINLATINVGAEALNPSQHGTFRFIFSVNVLEHVSDLAAAMRGMASVLLPGGRMWHTCPNYVFPYEPHLGLLLIPIFASATRLILPRRISRGDVWRSLNFITYFGLRRLAHANGLRTRFRTGTMADALQRLNSDSEFAARHPGIVAHMYSILKAFRAQAIIKALPAAFCTPMMVSMENPIPTEGPGAHDRD
jgi:2-polyprenyl-3-methyl-5-hydroxy-6-metoxy-1,4-benzoquinol methylase